MWGAREETELNLMSLVDTAPFIRVTDYIWFTRVLLESFYRPYVLRTPNANGYATVWAQSKEDAGRAGSGKVTRPKWEKGFLVRAGDVLVVAERDGGMITIAR